MRDNRILLKNILLVRMISNGRKSVLGILVIRNEVDHFFSFSSDYKNKMIVYRPMHFDAIVWIEAIFWFFLKLKKCAF